MSADALWVRLSQDARSSADCFAVALAACQQLGRCELERDQAIARADRLEDDLARMRDERKSLIEQWSDLLGDAERRGRERSGGPGHAIPVIGVTYERTKGR